MNPDKVGIKHWIAYVCAGKKRGSLKLTEIDKRVNYGSIQTDETKTMQQEFVFIFSLRKERNV